VDHSIHMRSFSDNDTAEGFGGWPLCPDQYYDIAGRRHFLEAEQALMFAVLRDALECYLGDVTTRDLQRQRAIGEVERRIDADEDRTFSFVHLCETFNISPSASRTAVKKIRNDPRLLADCRPRLRTSAVLPRGQAPGARRRQRANGGRS
jgi:hypothetical protein